MGELSLDTLTRLISVIQTVKKVLIIGGTGKTGNLLAKDFLDSGVVPVCFGRTASKESVPSGALAFRGDSLSKSSLSRSMEDVDTIVVCLSISRDGGSPFSKVVGDRELHSKSMRAIVGLAKEYGIDRVLKISAQGVGDSWNRAGIFFRGLVVSSNLRTAFSDHELSDYILSGSGLNWTIIRPPILDGRKSRHGLITGTMLKTRSYDTVSREELSAWIVKNIGRRVYFNSCLTIKKAKHSFQ